MLFQNHRSGQLARLRSWFPDREFFMRSGGQVRFIKISGRTQMIAAGIATALVLLWAAAMIAVSVTQYFSTRDRLALLQREAKVADAESRYTAYRGNISKVAEDLERRQQLLEAMSERYFPGAAAAEPATDALGTAAVSDSSTESAKAIDKISAAIPEAAPLARLEARQLAFAEHLTRMADHRANRAAQAIRNFGLNPAVMAASAQDRSAQGGPFLPFFRNAKSAMDPRFARLGASLARMAALEQGLAGIPNSLPAQMEFISSGFGYRSDPFTGAGAMHSGLDFRGPHGAPIHAAAKGVISFAGVRSGYGNTVEISHGNGLMTRYAHLSSIRVVPGQRVAAGGVLGGMGSTGRSTGTHLHFEVRINDRAVNPRPFLEARYQR